MEFKDSVKRNVTTSAYAQFSGRASRSEYWWFALGFLLIVFVAAFVDGLVGTGGVLSLVAILGLMIPQLAVGVRRLHDTGKSGWYWLINIIPIASIVMLIWLAASGDKGPNKYGPPSM